MGNNTILSQLNSPAMYLICGVIVLFVALVSLFFLIRAYRAGISVGMDRTKLRRTVTASATFASRYSPSGIMPISAATVLTIPSVTLLPSQPISLMHKMMPKGMMIKPIHLTRLVSERIISLCFGLPLCFAAMVSFPA